MCQKSVLVQKKMNKHPLLNKKCYKIHKINELRKYFLIQTAIPLIIYKKVKVKINVIVKVKFIVKVKVIVKVFILLQST